MKTEVVKINPNEFGIEENKANEIQQGLNVAIAERELLIKEFEVVSKLEITVDNLKKFKELRLKIVKNRTQGIENWHKINKEYFLRGGQFVDAIKRKEIQVNESMESVLTNAEKHFENLEKQRIEKLNSERIELLEKYYPDAKMLNLGIMDDEVFEAYLSTKKKSFEERIEAEKKAEEERIAKEKEETKRIRLQEIENKKLKAEAEAREKEIEAERKANEENLRIEREKAEKERQKIEAENNTRLKAVQEARVKLEIELKTKKDAEIKAENERKEAELKALKEAEKLKKAPIKNQLSIWVDSFELSSTNIDNETSKEIIKKFNSFKVWAKNEVNNI